MSWKDRAQPVVDSSSPSGDWKSRAVVNTPSEEPTYVQGMFKTYKGAPKTISQKADVAIGKAGKFALEAINAPFEALDPISATIEGRPAQPPTIMGGENPANPLSTINKLLRAGGGAISGVGNGNVLDSARAAYNAPRGTMGTVEDTAMGLLLGKIAPEAVAAPADTAVAGLSKGAKVLAKGAEKAAGFATKKAIRVGLGTTEEAQSILFNRPQDVARQTNFSDLGDKLAESANALSNKVGQLDDAAWETLGKLKAEPRSKLIDILKSVKREFVGTGKTKIGNADRQAAAQIDNYINRVQSIKQPGATPGTEQFLDQPQIKDIVQSIQKDARYDLPDTDPINRAVQTARAKIDSYLKTQNPAYEEAMKPVADATSALKDMTTRFRLERKTNGEFLPTKVTVDRLASSVKGKAPEISRTLENIKKVTGVDFADEAKLTATKLHFEAGDKSRGSARTNLGAIVGGATGGALDGFVGGGIGTTVGGLAGRAADYYGGPISEAIINSLRTGKTETGNVLSAINAKTQGTPLQSIIQQIAQEKPVLLPLLLNGKSGTAYQ